MKVRKIRVYGVVQGIGFRPFIKKLADDMGLSGSVCNRGAFVEIILLCDDNEHLLFRERMMAEAPAPAEILQVEDEVLDDEPDMVIPGSEFEITGSIEHKGERFIPADIAICDECARELYEKGNRRYLHPFINCTNCGPRLTVIRKLPYDREQTSMDEFEMCSECAREYSDTGDRRFDAQPVCCNDCGPVLYAYKPGESDNRLEGDPVTEARRVIAAGGIVAVKGIGGFHLCCDATDPNAVGKLRKRKHRPVKPFAVMGKDMAALRAICSISPEDEEVLTSPARPIVILPRRSEAVGGNLMISPTGEIVLRGSFPAEDCAPGNPTLGVFLPYAPIQMLLFDYPDDVSDMPEYLVMTSGNISGAPLAITDEQADEMLGDFCDLILSHNRQILCRADDSVLQMDRGRMTMIRRSRGYAPLPIEGKKQDTTVLAVGGELKSTFCIGKDELYYPSTFIGEQTDIRSEVALRATIAHYLEALSIVPERVVCDMHPDYISSRIAEDIAREYGIRLDKIQHHYAHILSCMAENKTEGPVIGIALDGTGYGDDQAIWGGELLLCDRKGYKRIGSHKHFSQVGGDAAARAGWRIAVGMLRDRYGDDRRQAEKLALSLGLCTETEYEAVSAMYDAGARRIRSTSCARLFDAVAAVLGICRESSFEGEAAMALQFAAQRARKGQQEMASRYGTGISDYKSLISDINANERFELRREGEMVILPTDELFSYIISEYADGCDRDELALRFHAILIHLWHKAAVLAAKENGIGTVALSGGCFVNTILSDLLSAALEEDGLEVIMHRMIPPNDGGIALGQAYAIV